MNVNPSQRSAGRAIARQIPWWNRPLFGKKSLTQRLLAPFIKIEVSERSIELHRHSFQEIKDIDQSAAAIDSEKIGTPEFLAFLRLKHGIRRGEVGFPGFEQSIELLAVGIQSKDTFLKVEQIEVSYRGSAQQELYRFVEDELRKGMKPWDFIYHLDSKNLEIQPKIKTDEGRVAVKSYIEALKYLSSHDLSFQLLTAFKQYQLANYSILQNISKLVHNITTKGIHDIKGLMTEVIAQQKSFEQLGTIIDIPADKNHTETYAIILQYITLSAKYDIAYAKFQELVGLLESWKNHYDTITRIREEFSSKEYKHPPDFKWTIPGIERYQKYEKYFQ